MPLETATHIHQLNVTNPTDSDAVKQGDNHIRLIKSVLKNTFPNLTGAVTGTQAKLNNILTSAGKTIKGRSSDGSGDTVDISMSSLKSMLGLKAAAYKDGTEWAAADHLHTNTYAQVNHTHNADDINQGTLASARLPSASTNYKGAVEKATPAEAAAGTSNKFPDAAAMKSVIDGIFDQPVSSVAFNPNGNRIQTKGHGLGRYPKIYDAYLVCNSTNQGWVPGERLKIHGYFYDDGGPWGGMSIAVTDTYVKFAGLGDLRAPHGTGGGVVILDKSKWTVVVDIYK